MKLAQFRLFMYYHAPSHDQSHVVRFVLCTVRKRQRYNIATRRSASRECSKVCGNSRLGFDTEKTHAWRKALWTEVSGPRAENDGAGKQRKTVSAGAEKYSEYCR